MRLEDRIACMATISNLLEIIGLFCRISSLLKGSFAKENHYFKGRTNRSHRIACVALSPPATNRCGPIRILEGATCIGTHSILTL